MGARQAFLALVLVLIATAAIADTVTYVYDPVRGQLTEVDYSNGTKTIYGYDLAGNRTAETVTCSGTGC